MLTHPWKRVTDVNGGNCIIQLGVWMCITLYVKYIKIFIKNVKNVTKILNMTLLNVKNVKILSEM